MTKHEIVSEEQWIEARRALLAEEKAWTRERDRLSQKRRALPWVKVEKNYVFEGVDGPVTLAELFDGRSQLVVYHFMFGPDWEEGFPGCSLLSDQVDGARQHFEHNNVSFVAVRAGQSTSSKPTASGWAGNSAGSPRPRALSTSTITYPSLTARVGGAFSTISRSGPIPR